MKRHSFYFDTLAADNGGDANQTDGKAADAAEAAPAAETTDADKKEDEGEAKSEGAE